MMQIKDASILLKEEIGESSLRLKAAKSGQKVSDITPCYDDQFYLPEMDKFRLPRNTSKTLVSKSVAI